MGAKPKIYLNFSIDGFLADRNSRRDQDEDIQNLYRIMSTILGWKSHVVVCSTPSAPLVPEA